MTERCLRVARPPCQGGIAYLALLLTLAVIAVVTVHAVRLGAQYGQRDAEEELLHIGLEFSQALERYANATPAGLPRAPARLEDLLRDPRYPGVVRHLRRIPEDPMGGTAQWGLKRNAQGQIVGLHSLSAERPIRSAGPLGYVAPASSAEPGAYRDWVFWGPLGLARP